MVLDCPRCSPGITEAILGSPPPSLPAQMQQFPSQSQSECVLQHHRLSSAHLGPLQELLLTSPSTALSDHVPHRCHGNSVETPRCSISSYHSYAQNPVLGPRRPREGSQSPLPAVSISPAALSIPERLSNVLQVWDRQTSKSSYFTECPSAIGGMSTDPSL